MLKEAFIDRLIQDTFRFNVYIKHDSLSIVQYMLDTLNIFLFKTRQMLII